MEISLTKTESESLDEYRLRIGLACAARTLTWNKAAEYLNQATGNDFGECTWRKYFKAWFAGYSYGVQSMKGTPATRILSISDLHVPFQKPIDTFSRYVCAVDILQINGDVLDCHDLSSWPKTYHISPVEEMIEARQYLIDLIRFIKPAKVIVNYGNHDIRLQTHLAKSTENELLELLPKTPLELILNHGFHHFDKKNLTKVWYEPLANVFPGLIDYKDMWYSQIGSTIFCHPLTYSKGIMQTAERARRYFLDEGFTFDSLVMSHTHRTGHYDCGNTVIYEQGACCDTAKLTYSDGKLTPSQREGYIYLCQDANGHLIEDETKIIRLN